MERDTVDKVQRVVAETCSLSPRSGVKNIYGVYKKAMRNIETQSHVFSFLANIQ